MFYKLRDSLVYYTSDYFLKRGTKTPFSSRKINKMKNLLLTPHLNVGCPILNTF